MISKEQSILLDNALNSLSKKESETIKNIMIQIMNRDGWFYQLVNTILKNGVTFSSEVDEIPGRYDIAPKKVVINKEFLENYHKIAGGMPMLTSLLRHEMTHGFDHIYLDQSIKQGQWVKELDTVWNSLNFIKKLYNELDCVDKTARVDPLVLTKLSNLNLIAFQNIEHFRLSYYPIEQSNDKILDYSISNKDSTMPGFNLKSINVTSTFCLIDETYDQSHVQHATPILKNSKWLPMWQSLDKKQSVMLDLLYHLKTDALTYAKDDPLCYASMQQCATENNLDCYSHFYQCQIGNSTSLTPQAIHTVTELNALLFERVYAQKLSPALLNGLCLEPENTVENPAIQNVTQYTLQAGNSMLIGFLNETTLSYLKSQNVDCTNLVKFSIMMSAVLGVGIGNYMLSNKQDASFVAQILLPTASVLLSKGVEALVEHLAPPRIANITKNITKTLFVGTQFVANGITNSLVNLATNSSSYWVGSEVGKYVGSFFSTKNKIDTIEPGQNPENKFR